MDHIEARGPFGAAKEAERALRAMRAGGAVSQAAYHDALKSLKRASYARGGEISEVACGFFKEAARVLDLLKLQGAYRKYVTLDVRHQLEAVKAVVAGAR